MRRLLLGLLVASTLLAARPALADPPPATAPAAVTPAAVTPPAPAAAPLSPPIGPWAAPLAASRRRSSGIMIGGIALTALGALGMSVGTASYVTTVSDCNDARVQGQADGGVRCANGGTKIIAMSLLLAGAAGAAVGVPLWIYGAEKVAVPKDDPFPIRAAAVIVGPASAALHVSF